MSGKDFLEELVLDILLRLPMKAIVRFRCVSKSWGTLLSSPDFVYKSLLFDEENKYSHFMVKYRDVNTRNFVFSLLSHDTLDLVVTKDLPNPPGFDYAHNRGLDLQIVGSCCNGLICLGSSEHINEEGGIVLWNPATSETKVVPKLEVTRPPRTWDENNYLGFGFDDKTNDYKIVKVTGLWCNPVGSRDYENPAYKNEVALYSMKNGSWKIIDATIPFLRLTCESRLCCTGSGNIVYWEAYSREGHHVYKNAIVCFDMGSEELKATPTPEDHMFSWQMCSLFSLHKSLAMIVLREDKQRMQKSFEIWALFEAGVKDSWTKLFTVAGFPELEGPLGFQSNGDIFFETGIEGLLTINPLTQARRDVQVVGKDCNFQIVPYKATQVSLQEETEVGSENALISP
ncbi:hypothetical protein Tsubulata_036374 [Turnera subulata]|uniref:F-box domain-containing protein n=1 Tax=Turnera subulata TaxID=218843 RepID=A0A9Q0G4X1_9ROSI|nr:hypothetical protein Tsubulata_036374 [Turnera subulata]